MVASTRLSRWRWWVSVYMLLTAMSTIGSTQVARWVGRTPSHLGLTTETVVPKRQGQFDREPENCRAGLGVRAGSNGARDERP